MLGLSFAAMVSGNFWVAFNMDILQIIAVGVPVLYLVQRYLKPGPWFHLGAALAVFALKLATDSLPRDLWWMTYLENILLEPGNFVVIPWLFPFFLGMFCHLASKPLQPLAGGNCPACDGPDAGGRCLTWASTTAGI